MSDTNQQAHQKKSEKFLHLFWEFPPFIQGGLGVAGEALCTALSQHGQVDIACPETTEKKADHSKPYTIYQVKMPSASDLVNTYVGNSDEFEIYTNNQIASFSRGVTCAHFTGYTAIHAHDWITADAAEKIQEANQPAHIPIILHIHSTQLDRVGTQSNGTIFQREKLAMEKADRIITVSELTKQTIIHHYQIPQEKITVIRNSIAKLNNPIVRPPHPPTILFVARLESQKSPLFAVEVICAALKKVPQARAIIAGKGSSLGAIRDLVKFKKMESRIEVLGHIPHEKMHLAYQVSDVLILPSASEPYGLVALEAAQAGAAVILSDRCGVGETLRSAPKLSLNTTTSFNSWVDITVNFLENKELRQQQVEQQQADLSQYNWEEAARNLVSELEK